MNFLIDKCSVFPLTEQLMNQCRRFSCGDKDLDDFFFQDAAKYERQLLGKTYCFRLDNDNSVIVYVYLVQFKH